MIKKHQRYIYLASTLAVMSMSQHAAAAGFALIENSASGMGNAYAGSSAVAEDASTVFFNPAGLTKLKERQVTLAGHIVSPSADYTDKGSSINPAFTGGTQFPGSLTGPNDDGGGAAFVPNFFFATPINEKATFGLGITAPFGLETDYKDDWIGRYHALNSAIQTVNLNPSVGYKVNEKLSVGGGVNAQYVHAKLSQAIDSSAVCLKASDPATCASLGLATPSNQATDSKAELDADGWSFGFNVGLLYDIQDRTTIGASYRSGVEHDAEGDAKFTINPALQPIIAGANAQLSQIDKALLIDSDISASVGLPDTASFSIAHMATPRLQLLGDITWTGWSSFDELRIKYDSGQDDSVTDESWENNMRYSLGLNYKKTDRLTLRTGVAFDETPIKDETYRTPRIPGNDRTWLSFGAGYDFSKRMHIDVGYSHLFVDNTDINHTDDNGYTINGEYEADVNILSAQVNWKF